MPSNNVNVPYFEFNGKCYGIGTKVLLKDEFHGTGKAEVVGFNRLFRPIYVGIEPGFDYEISDVFSIPSSRILEIIEPVEVFPKNNETLYCAPGYPSQGEVQIGWVWYIAIMLLLSIFEDRIFGWCCVTLFFWMWLKTKK